jgi:hypothetical protein
MPGDEFRVGDVVRVMFAGQLYRARVVEDRGRIGVGGRRLLRVEIMDTETGDEPRRFEVPAEQVHSAA